MKKIATRVLVVVLAALLVLAIYVTAHVVSTPPIPYYTDGVTIRQELSGAPLRQVLWNPPVRLEAPIFGPGDEHEAHVSPDGQTLYFVRGRPGHDADLYVADRAASGWARPRPLTTINSPADELGPALAPDGRTLFFHSNRAGGAGGYDLWSAVRDGRDGWHEPVNLGSVVNSPDDEYGACVDPDARTLYFASNRPGVDHGADDTPPDDRNYDLYAVGLGSDPGPPRPLDELNSPYDEGAPAISPVADFLYYASNRPGGHGGFDLYRSRRLPEGFDAPVNLDAPVNTAANEIDPAMAEQGFVLLFSSDRPVAVAADAAGPERVAYDLYASASREVFRATENRGVPWSAIFRLIAPLLPWVVAAVILALLLPLALALLRGDSERLRPLSILARCLLLSLVAHVIIVVLCMAWAVASGVPDLLGRSTRGTRVALTSTTLVDGVTTQVRGALAESNPLDPSSGTLLRQRPESGAPAPPGAARLAPGALYALPEPPRPVEETGDAAPRAAVPPLRDAGLVLAPPAAPAAELSAGPRVAQREAAPAPTIVDAALAPVTTVQTERVPVPAANPVPVPPAQIAPPGAAAIAPVPLADASVPAAAAPTRRVRVDPPRGPRAERPAVPVPIAARERSPEPPPPAGRAPAAHVIQAAPLRESPDPGRRIAPETFARRAARDSRTETQLVEAPTPGMAPGAAQPSAPVPVPGISVARVDSPPAVRAREGAIAPPPPPPAPAPGSRKAAVVSAPAGDARVSVAPDVRATGVTVRTRVAGEFDDAAAPGMAADRAPGIAPRPEASTAAVVTASPESLPAPVRSEERTTALPGPAPIEVRAAAVSSRSPRAGAVGARIARVVPGVRAPGAQAMVAGAPPSPAAAPPPRALPRESAALAPPPLVTVDVAAVPVTPEQPRGPGEEARAGITSVRPADRPVRATITGAARSGPPALASAPARIAPERGAAPRASVRASPGAPIADAAVPLSSAPHGALPSRSAHVAAPAAVDPDLPGAPRAETEMRAEVATPLRTRAMHGAPARRPVVPPRHEGAVSHVSPARAPRPVPAAPSSARPLPPPRAAPGEIAADLAPAFRAPTPDPAPSRVAMSALAVGGALGPAPDERTIASPRASAIRAARAQSAGGAIARRDRDLGAVTMLAPAAPRLPGAMPMPPPPAGVAAAGGAGGPLDAGPRSAPRVRGDLPPIVVPPLAAPVAQLTVRETPPRAVTSDARRRATALPAAGIASMRGSGVPFAANVPVREASRIDTPARAVAAKPRDAAIPSATVPRSAPVPMAAPPRVRLPGGRQAAGEDTDGAVRTARLAVRPHRPGRPAEVDASVPTARNLTPRTARSPAPAGDVVPRVALPAVADAARVEVPGAADIVDRIGLGRLRPRVEPRLPAQTETPYPQRAPERRAEILAKKGGSRQTERAVADALDWLMRHQADDGRWDGARFDVNCGLCKGSARREVSVAVTAIALLSFFAADHTHVSEGPYREGVARALTWLLVQQSARGDFIAGETMYTHGAATIALAEAYGITGDETLRDPLERAVAFVIQARNRFTGGWRYVPGQDGDTSVLGWQVMALISARRAGVTVPEEAFRGARKWLRGVTDPNGRGRYAYRPRRAPTPSMTAEAMYVQQLLGMPPDDPAMDGSARMLLDNLPEWNQSQSSYYWFYGSLALFQHGGLEWGLWNTRMKETLLANQVQSGPAAGSWPPHDVWAQVGGRVYQTALCALTLEVYYRYLPLYVDQDGPN